MKKMEFTGMVVILSIFAGGIVVTLHMKEIAAYLNL